MDNEDWQMHEFTSGRPAQSSQPRGDVIWPPAITKEQRTRMDTSWCDQMIQAQSEVMSAKDRIVVALREQIMVSDERAKMLESFWRRERRAYRRACIQLSIVMLAVWAATIIIVILT